MARIDWEISSTDMLEDSIGGDHVFNFTGQEAYQLAIQLLEHCRAGNFDNDDQNIRLAIEGNQIELHSPAYDQMMADEEDA